MSFLWIMRNAARRFGNIAGYLYQSKRGIVSLGAILVAQEVEQSTRGPNNPNFNKFYNQPIKPSSTHEISWTDFCYRMVAGGEVEKVIVSPKTGLVVIYLFDGAIVDGRRILNRRLTMKILDADDFERKLREFESSLGISSSDAIPIYYDHQVDIISKLIPFLLIAGFFATKGRKALTKGIKQTNIFSKLGKANFTLVDPTNPASSNAIRFKDVAGLKEAKVEIMEFVDYLKNSEKFIKLGAKVPRGALLTGPPGCGKTLLAKAVATEASVPFLALAGTDFVEMIGGVGAARVRNLFKKAKKLSPCIIYIDEIDSIGKRRTSSSFDAGQSEMEQTLNQLLVEMDGMITRTGIILLASTNRVEVLDNALTRAGRFDRQIVIDLPNLEERKEIFEQYATKIKMAKPPSEHSELIAKLTAGMSGADIANVCNEAALNAARNDRPHVIESDFDYAIGRIIGGLEKKSSTVAVEEKRIIAYHESGHALVGWLLEHTEPLLKISIVPRTQGILGYAQYMPSERKLHSKEQFYDQMCMALGGRVAELLKFNHLSTGAQNDLQKVTKMAAAQITQFGFDDVIGQLSFPENSEDQGMKPYSKHLANIIDKRASILVADAFRTTQKLLSSNLDKLEILAQALLQKEVLSADDVKALIGHRPHQKNNNI